MPAFLKLFEEIYAPLTADLLHPVSADTQLQTPKRTQVDRIYQRIDDDLDQILNAVGFSLR